ncbi:MAG: Mrp/NBP35 family ATP-binding protein [Candidatus Freyarchaeota archaeon]|nr:Mrp/NBP35 family ATP-binding protein [Candidatus Jordarchaeia archaeon]
MAEKGKYQVQHLQTEEIKKRMFHVKHKIVVMSGKGGVGKSTVAANLAVVLAEMGRRVGLMDADLHGPSIPKILGVQGVQPQVGPTGIYPIIAERGVKVISIDFFLPSSDSPVIWRGPLKMAAIRQFLSDIEWGDLDYLLVDLPPGTGDEPLSVMQLIPGIDGVVIVTVPSDLSQYVVKKAVSMAYRMGVRVIGIVENMSGFVCPNCGARFDLLGSGGGEKISTEMDVPFLGKIPIDPSISGDTDQGTPFTLKHPDSPAAKAFREIVERVVEAVEGKNI